jgi:serine/threonine protein kinase
MHVGTDLEFDRSTLLRNTEEMKVLLDLTLYHMKPLKAFFACTGNIQSSLFHYFKIMTQLHRFPDCREVVLFPICVREYEDSIDHCSIVFPKLGCDYKIGLPDTQEQRERYFEKLKSAIRAIHMAGVVHLDLYLSNIMWKELESGEIELKIIDWDAAHFITESLFADAQIRISGRFRAQLHEVVMKNDRVDQFDHKVSMQYYDISLIRVLETYADYQALATRTKEELDTVCIEIQSWYINAIK